MKNKNLVLPCVNCICLAICRTKKLKYMFQQCQLIDDFFIACVDDSTNRTAVHNLLCASNNLNKTFNRYFIPCFIGQDLDLDTIGLADIDPEYSDDTIKERVENTYEILKRTFGIDLLNVERLKYYLLLIVGDDI